MKREQQALPERRITLPGALLLGFTTELPVSETASFLEALDVKKGEEFLSHLPYINEALVKPWLDLCSNARNAITKTGDPETELSIDELLSLSVFTRSYKYRGELPTQVIDTVEATFLALSRDERFTRKLSIKELDKTKRLVEGLQKQEYLEYSGLI